MEPRTRTRNVLGTPGTVYTVNGGVETVLGTQHVVLEEWSCQDAWKKKVRKDSSLPPSNAVISKHYRDPFCMNRDVGVFRFRNHAVQNQGTTTVGGLDNVRPPLGSLLRETENKALALELLAATNPFRAEFSVPVAIKELIDVSSLFKIAAKGFFSFVGGNYLNYKFGWEQFVRDVKTLHGITSTIERRIKELDSLSKHGGLRRSVGLRSSSKDYFEAGRVVQSAWGVTIRVNVSGGWRCHTSGTVRWRVKEGLTLNLSKLEAFNAAVSAVFDLGELDSQTMWNLVPFSWLADYFVGLNEYFGAQLGSDLVEPYDICIIRRCRSTFKQRVVEKPSDVSLTGSGSISRVHMERDVVSPSALSYPSIQFLSWNQLLIIAALAASFKR